MHKEHGKGNIDLDHALVQQVGLGHRDKCRLAPETSLDVLRKRHVACGNDQGIVTLDVAAVAYGDLQVKALKEL